MRNRLRYTLLALFTLGIFSSACGQAPTAELPRTADGKPRLDGIWQALTEANWDVRPHAAGPAPLAEMGTFSAIHPGLGIIEGGEIPYQPWAAEQQQQNFANRLELDPEGKCFLPGVPRATYLPYPFQILQTPQHVMIAYQFANAVRTIHMTDPGPAPADSWMGWSVGRWEGDTLVVRTTRINWDYFDRQGAPMTTDVVVDERFTVVEDGNRLNYLMTVTDPAILVRPFVWDAHFIWRRGEEVNLYDCTLEYQ